MEYELYYVSSEFVPSESFKYQGAKNSRKKFGYKTVYFNNGFNVEAKPSKVYAYFTDSNGQEEYKIDIRISILNFFDRSKMTKKLYNEFKKYAENNLLRFFMDDESNDIIIK